LVEPRGSIQLSKLTGGSTRRLRVQTGLLEDRNIGSGVTRLPDDAWELAVDVDTVAVPDDLVSSIHMNNASVRPSSRS
jgi:hypothetical protein